MDNPSEPDGFLYVKHRLVITTPTRWFIQLLTKCGITTYLIAKCSNYFSMNENYKVYLDQLDPTKNLYVRK